MAKGKIKTKKVGFLGLRFSKGTLLILAGILVILSIFITYRIRAKVLGLSDATTPYGQSGSWTLKFNDEFDSTALDTTKWKSGYSWGSTDVNMGNTSATNISLDGQYLHLKAAGNATSFTIGAVTSRQTFQYGYMEAKMKIPKGNGTWPAWWIYSETSSPSQEIDVLEYLGNTPNYFYSTVKLGGNENSQVHYNHGADLSADFHVYGVNVTPTGMKLYFDGREILNNTDNFHQFKSLILDNGIMCKGIIWDGNKCDANTFTNNPETLVDWVRVWEPSTSTTVTTTQAPTATATVRPTATATPRPTATATVRPTATATPRPTATTTVRPTATATPRPTATTTPTISQDNVSIISAYITRYTRKVARLTVTATSSASPTAKLYVTGYGQLRYSKTTRNYRGTFWLYGTWPTSVVVVSSLGGTDTFPVTLK